MENRNFVSLEMANFKFEGLFFAENRHFSKKTPETPISAQKFLVENYFQSHFRAFSLRILEEIFRKILSTNSRT